MVIFRRGKGISGGVLRAEFGGSSDKGLVTALAHKLFESELTQN